MWVVIGHTRPDLFEVFSTTTGGAMLIRTVHGNATGAATCRGPPLLGRAGQRHTVAAGKRGGDMCCRGSDSQLERADRVRCGDFGRASAPTLPLCYTQARVSAHCKRGVGMGGGHMLTTSGAEIRLTT